MTWTRAEHLMCGVFMVLIHAPLVAQLPPSWTQVSLSGPSPRSSAMAYDSQRGRCVLFGGGGTNYAGYFSQWFSDTWEWDGANWFLTASAGPSARIAHAMAYDSQRGRTVLFGGYDQTALLGDTWEWNGTSWIQVAMTGPSARAYSSMAYDSQRGQTVLFGGQSGSVSDTWEWNGATWTLAANIGPPVRNGVAMTYNSQRARTVLFAIGWSGGFSGWILEWDGNAWAVVSNDGPFLDSASIVYDAQHGRIVLFGGMSTDFSASTWEWNGTRWTNVAGGGPAARAVAAMAYDSRRGRTVLFGGATSYFYNYYLGDTWERDGRYLGIGVAFGYGCGVPTLTLSPIASREPEVNRTAQASLSNIPSAFAFVALGWSPRIFHGSAVLPLSLGQYGMPGCYLWQSADAIAMAVVFNGTGTATFSQSIPNDPALLSQHVYLQGCAIAPGFNPANLIVSNGMEWVIGDS